MLSQTICFAAIATAIRPEAHWRSIVWPATDVGKPARSSDWRAVFWPVEPCCIAQPITTSSTSSGSIFARSAAAVSAWAASVCACVSLKAPR